MQGMSYPLGKGPLVFRENGAPFRKTVASPKATYAQTMAFYENEVPIQKVVYPPRGIATVLYKNGAPSQKMALYENKVPKQGNPLIHFGKNFSHQKKTSFLEKRRVLKMHEPSLRWNKMNQNGKKVVPRTNGKHENLETLNFSRKGEVICKQ
ncbi:hypothetical protein ACH5RR_015646 [Cinchona calisaya]|uniref:Uncharacterized protein n=1 Tax=Cinchona calisaya TaxID=153742 RepID=A0ABD2ZXB9_9GENT